MSMTEGGNQGGGGGFLGNIWSNRKPAPQGLPQNPQQQPNNQPQGGSGDNNDKPNVAPNDKLIDDIWNEPKKPVDPNAQQQQQQQQTQQPDAKAQLKQHLEDMGIGDFELTEAEIQAFRDGGNVNEIFGRVNARIQQGYVKLLSNVNSLMDKRIEDAVKKAVSQSASMFQGEQLREVLHEALPFTKDPTISPFAETVFRRFMEKPEATKQQALDNTKKYFQRLHTKMDPDYQGYNEKNSNTRQNFRGAPQPGDRQGKPAGDDQSWLDVLTGNADSHAR